MHVATNSRVSCLRRSMKSGRPTSSKPANDIGTANTTENRSPAPTSDAILASELPRPANVTAGILESGAKNNDFTGKGFIFMWLPKAFSAAALHDSNVGQR